MATVDPIMETELATYRKILPDLLANNGEGKYVVIHGDKSYGTFGTYEDALTVGYEKIGFEPFLVKRVVRNERGHFFTRDIKPAAPRR
jgi:hypothetical protein